MAFEKQKSFPPRRAYIAGTNEAIYNWQENGIDKDRQFRFTALRYTVEDCLNPFSLGDHPPLDLAVLEIDVAGLNPNSLSPYPPDGIMVDIRGSVMFYTDKIPADSLKLLQLQEHSSLSSDFKV